MQAPQERAARATRTAASASSRDCGGFRSVYHDDRVVVCFN
ncbi:hypothetical protein [Halobellus captivus]|nr:hypothetical protein [Halobellus captivus]